MAKPNSLLTSQKLFLHDGIAARAASMLDIVYLNTAHRRAGGGLPLYSIDPENQNFRRRIAISANHLAESTAYAKIPVAGPVRNGLRRLNDLRWKMRKNARSANPSNTSSRCPNVGRKS